MADALRNITIAKAALGRMQSLSTGSGDQASGAQALFWHLPDLRLPGCPWPLVFKQYRETDRMPAVHGLAVIIAIRQRLDEAHLPWFDATAAWPLRCVINDGLAVGVVMRLAPDDFYQTIQLRALGTTQRKLCEVQHLMASEEDCNKIGMPFADRNARFGLCATMAYFLAFLHKRDVVFGDISATNELFTLEPKPRLMFIDCDAVRKVGAASVVDQLNTPDWVPPEGPRLQTKETDSYKLGLFILRTLTPRRGGTQTTDPQLAKGILNPIGAELLEKALGPAGNRTTPKEWYEHFRGDG